MWKPLTPRHAIDTMAMVITHVEPISSLVFRRLIRILEPTTFEQGLTNRQPMQAITFNFEAGAPAQVRQMPANGMQFQKQSLTRDSMDNVVNKVVEELVIDPSHMLYKNMNYSRWETVSSYYWKMCSEAISVITDTVAIKTIRLEYLDRFIFAGDPSAASATGVIRQESDLVSPHIFSQHDLWHSHTGKFEPLGNGDRRLHQVNIDMVDITGGDFVGSRSIAVMTAVEDRFEGSGLEEATGEALRLRFNDLHEIVKTLFCATIDDGMLRAVGLKND